jgi:DNA replication licensing factor MCM4
MEQTDPITGQIDLDLINTGAGQQARRMRSDLKREVSSFDYFTSHS